MSRSPSLGTIYLIHFDVPFGHARHYMGWTADLNARLAAHASGRGSKLMAAVSRAHISWQVSRTWVQTTRRRERQLKVQGGHSRKCPQCGVRPRKRA